MGIRVKRLFPALVILAVFGLVAACGGPSSDTSTEEPSGDGATNVSDGGTETQGGEIRAVDLVGAWVDAGAENGEFEYVAEDGNTYIGTYEDDIQPMWNTANYWGPNTMACTACHSAVSESSMHEMGLATYDDFMKGGDSLSHPDDPEYLVVPGDWSGSSLRARLRNNRMPPGVEFDVTEENRDGPTVTAGRPK